MNTEKYVLTGNTVKVEPPDTLRLDPNHLLKAMYELLDNCQHCKYPRCDHAKDQCLFGSTKFKGPLDDYVKNVITRVNAP